MSDFWNVYNVDLWIGLGLAVVNAVLMCFEGYKFMQIIQLNGYNIKGYFSWLKNTRGKYIGRLAILVVLGSAAMLVTNAIFNGHLNYLAYMGVVVYFVLTAYFLKYIYSAPKKTPLKMTKRMSRSMVLLFLVNFVISSLLIALSSMFISFFRFGALAIAPLFLPVIVPFVHWVLMPLENGINRAYVIRAKKKLKDFPNLIKIGITGSYGKTSVKNFLHTILSEKYNVCSSPLNYNTPTGITKTVLDFLSFGHQVLICEMGARQKGDILELCKIVEPNYGIVTSIGGQHLATFKTIENVVATKSELPKYLGKDGLCVFNFDDETLAKIYPNFECKKAISSLNKEEANAFATDIITGIDGTDFSLLINGKKFKCHTSLLGKHNIINVLMCVPLALELGLTPEQIVKGIEKIRPVEHRLYMIKEKNDVIVLDDAYNASVEGSKRALEVLSMFKGRRKIVVTPGLVELGNLERLANYEFGKRISKVADIVIIVNKIHYASIKQGLLDEGFAEDKILNADNFLKSQKLLTDIILSGDIILWENDLPDNYT